MRNSTVWENLDEAITTGLERKAQEFNRHGGKIYNKI